MDYLNLQKTIKSNISNIYENDIYNGRYEFLLSHTNGHLEQCFIKATLSTGNVATTVKSNFGLKIFKSIRLHDGASTLALCTSFSNVARTDLLIGGVLEDRITSSTQPTAGAFLAGDVVLYIPLMFWFSDSVLHSLDMLNRNQLYIEVITNNNKGDMGLSVDLTSAKYELFSKYRQTGNFSKVPKVITNSYSTYQEKPVLCLAGTTSTKIKMECPYECFYVHFLILSADSTKGVIKNYKIDIPNMEIADTDYLMNYSMSTQDSFNNGSTLSLKFGSRDSIEKDFIKFSQEMSPTTITLTFNSLGANSYVYTTCEYFTDLFNDKGEVKNMVTGLFYTS
jgi:hypothetical protein